MSADRLWRSVNPSLSGISGWISSLGASIAITDLDGDGFPNDLCYVDPRSDQVIVTPAPSTGSRYAAFSLRWGSSRGGTVAPMGCLPGDLNEDGWMDLLIYFWGRSPAVFLRIPGKALRGGFIRRELLAENEEQWFTNAATLADVNGDGHLDVVIGNYFQDGAEILNPRSEQRQSMQHSMSRAYNGGRNRLLLWESAVQGARPAVAFRDASYIFDEHIAHAWTLAVGAADLDGDLLPELYFANDFGPDRLLHNRSTNGQLRFATLEGIKGLFTANSKVLGRDSFKGMGVDFGDVNDDGRLDILVSNLAAEYSLEESHFTFVSTGETERMKYGIAPYVDRSESLGLSRSGWAWDVRLGDFDNDGIMEVVQATGFVKGEVNRWPELHEVAMGNDELLSDPRVWPRFGHGDDLSGYQQNAFFVRGSDGRYYDIAREVGINKPYVTRGVATADVDNDGDLDFLLRQGVSLIGRVLVIDALEMTFRELRFRRDPACSACGVA